MWTKVITTAGLELLSRVNKGKLVLTKSHAGAGQISDNQLVNAVAISQYKRDLIVTQVTNKSSAVAIRLELNNTGLGTSFELYQIGLYAQVEGDAADVLLYIMQSDTAEYIPSAAESAGYINDYVVQVNISQTDNISATIDPAGLVTIGQMDNKLDGKVDKVEGKGLSTNDYTTAEKSKLAGVADNANNYAHPATHPYSMITGTPTSLPANGGTAANVPWTGVTGKPTTFPATTHTHDDRYYTEAEINAQMAGKASTAVATTSANGLMSKEDKTNLDDLSSPLITNIYISNTGNDTTGDGTEVNPYKTLNYVLTMLESTKYNGAGVSVYLKSGESFNLDMTKTYELMQVASITIQSNVINSTRATLNVTTTGSYRINAAKIGFTDLNINLSQSTATAYAALINVFFCAVIRCSLTSINNATFAWCGDSTGKMQISLLQSQITGKVKLIGTTNDALAGIVLLRVANTSFGAETSITDEAKTLSQLVNVGDWYTTGKMPYAPSGYGLGTACTMITDWNNVTVTGWYRGSNAANAVNNQWWMGQCLVHDDNWQLQIASDFTNNARTFVRQKQNNVWSKWLPIEGRNISVSTTAPTAFIGESIQHQTY